MKNWLVQTIAEIKIDPNTVNVPKGEIKDATIANGLQLVFGLAGAIALIVITIGALQYVISQGNPQSTAKAKDTIMYALIGLVICALGYSIVSFVVKDL